MPKVTLEVPEEVAQLLDGIGTRRRKCSQRQRGFIGGELACITVGLRDMLGELDSERWAFVLEHRKMRSLRTDGGTPGFAALRRLELPFQQMLDQDPVSGDQRPFVAAAQAFDLLDDIGQVDLGKTTLTQELGLLVAPEIKIALICGRRIVKRLNLGLAHRRVPLVPAM